jgi:uncharacterized protein (TIGR02996 family)
VVLAALLVAGCRAQRVRPPLAAVSLPDLSGSADTVRKQLQEAHARLSATLDAANATDGDRAESFGSLGMLLLAAEHFDEAQTCFSNAEQLQSSDPRWPYYLGQVHWGRGEAAPAANEFARALQRQPNDVPTLIWLGEARLAEGRLDEASTALEHALTIEPQSAGASFALGRVALAKRDYPEAVRLLEQTRALDPLALAVHYPLAMAYRGTGDEARAEVHLRQRGDVRVRFADPRMESVDALIDSAEAYDFRGKRALSAGDWSDAITQFRRGVELAPGNPSLRHQLATAMALSGDTQGAITEFEEVVRRTPGFSRAYLSLGVLLEATGRRPEALAHLRRAVEIDPDYADGHRRLAEVLLQSGQTAEALAQFADAIRSNPRDADVRLEYADALMRSGRGADAHRELTEGARLHPDRAEFTQALSKLETDR